VITVELKTNTESAAAIGKWLEDNVGKWEHGHWQVTRSTKRGYWDIAFKDEKMATLFLLRWS